MNGTSPYDQMNSGAADADINGLLREIEANEAFTPKQMAFVRGMNAALTEMDHRLVAVEARLAFFEAGTVPSKLKRTVFDLIVVAGDIWKVTPDALRDADPRLMDVMAARQAVALVATRFLRIGAEECRKAMGRTTAAQFAQLVRFADLRMGETGFAEKVKRLKKNMGIGHAG